MSNSQNKLKRFAKIFVLSTLSSISYAQNIIPGGNSWVDSYSVDGKCYCSSTYDHGIGDFTVETPAGTRSVVEVCEAIGPGPGRGSNPGYNTIQCGNSPGHSDTGTFNFTDGVRRTVADEIECPGRVDIGWQGCDDIGPEWDLSVFGTETDTDTDTDTTSNLVHITKRNARGYAFDGDREATNRQDVYLWESDDENINQQWIEIDRGDGFYSYQKFETNHCIDGNNGGELEQNIHLWKCRTDNQNQHWLKVEQSSGGYKLIKRNAADFAINGGSNGAPGRVLNLWDSSSSSRDLHWFITPIDTPMD